MGSKICIICELTVRPLLRFLSPIPAWIGIFAKNWIIYGKSYKPQGINRQKWAALSMVTKRPTWPSIWPQTDIKLCIGIIIQRQRERGIHRWATDLPHQSCKLITHSVQRIYQSNGWVCDRQLWIFPVTEKSMHYPPGVNKKCKFALLLIFIVSRQIPIHPDNDPHGETNPTESIVQSWVNRMAKHMCRQINITQHRIQFKCNRFAYTVINNLFTNRTERDDAEDHLHLYYCCWVEAVRKSKSTLLRLCKTQ